MVARKIEHAVGAARLFTDRLQRRGIDRGALFTFGNTFKVEQNFTNSPAELDVALSGLPDTIGAAARAGNGEGTRCYDSLHDAAEMFQRNADPDRPWVMIAVTDGMDNASRTYRNDPAGIGRRLASGFNARRASFPFLIGVGTGKQIDRHALATVGANGHFPAVLLDSFDMLQQLFLTLAVRVTRGLTSTTLRGPGFVFSEIQPTLRVERRPIDFAFVIDRSGSMNGSN
jgi:Mg-chelatase subunit ChlD